MAGGIKRRSKRRRRRGKWIFIDDLYSIAAMCARGRKRGHRNHHYQLLLEHALETSAAFSLARALFSLPPRSFLFGSVRVYSHLQNKLSSSFCQARSCCQKPIFWIGSFSKVILASVQAEGKKHKISRSTTIALDVISLFVSSATIFWCSRCVDTALSSLSRAENLGGTQRSGFIRSVLPRNTHPRTIPKLVFE